MTFKSAVAGLPLGGGKGVIALPAGRRAADGPRAAATVLLDFGDDRRRRSAARYVTAEDVGTSTRDMHVDRRGHDATSPGLPAPRRRLGRPEPVDRARRRGRRSWPRASARSAARRWRAARVAVVGLGHVGLRARPPARPPAGRGSSSPTSTAAKRAQAERLGARWVTPARALTRAGRRPRALRAGRRARPRLGPAPAGAGRRRRGEQPARRRQRRRAARGPRDPVGARLRGQRRRDHQHRRRARAVAATTRPVPATRRRGRSATRCARSTTTRRAPGSRRWRRRWRSPRRRLAGASA